MTTQRSEARSQGVRSKVPGIDGRKRKSGRGQPQSKTWRIFRAANSSRQRLGLRLPSAAFSRIVPAPTAFTLIELLIVIAIIALLAAMIIPVIGGVKRAQLKHKAQAELVQVQTAIESYHAN